MINVFQASRKNVLKNTIELQRIKISELEAKIENITNFQALRKQNLKNQINTL